MLCSLFRHQSPAHLSAKPTVTGEHIRQSRDLFPGLNRLCTEGQSLS